MRLGIFGGTFDPVHYGHLLLAEQCREQCALDEVWFVPAREPPHKDSGEIAPAGARLEMLEFAVAGLPEFRISRLELDRPGPGYTVDTLRQLHEEDASRALFLLIGSDSLRDFPSWRDPQRILELATVVAVNRGNLVANELNAAVKALGTGAAGRIRIVEMPGVNISATDIRRRVREGRSIRFLTPRPVALYIAEHRLYISDQPPT